MHDGFLRVASATPTIQVANCPYNAQQIIAVAKQAAEKQVSAIVFPELCLTGYTCGDLIFSTNTADLCFKRLGNNFKGVKSRRYHLHCWSTYQSRNQIYITVQQCAITENY